MKYMDYFLLIFREVSGLKYLWTLIAFTIFLNYHVLTNGFYLKIKDFVVIPTFVYLNEFVLSQPKKESGFE